MSTNILEADPGRVSWGVTRLAHDTDMSEQTIRREIEDGRLRAVKVRGRLVITREAVAAWLNPE